MLLTKFIEFFHIFLKRRTNEEIPYENNFIYISLTQITQKKVTKEKKRKIFL